MDHPDLAARDNSFRRLRLANEFREFLPKFYTHELEKLRKGEVPSVISPVGLARAKLEAGVPRPYVELTIDSVEQVIAELLESRTRELPEAIKSEFAVARDLIVDHLYQQLLRAMNSHDFHCIFTEETRLSSPVSGKYSLVQQIAQFSVGNIPNKAMDPWRLARGWAEKGHSPEAIRDRLFAMGQTITEVNMKRPMAGQARQAFKDVLAVLKGKCAPNIDTSKNK
ncbi:MAG: hypothetical protein HYX94_13135 [Chloroflexi bacterium]|nr:hypothetical protein [Chloroflexota bacterium]